MYNKKDLTNLTDKLWQSSEFLFEYPNRKRKYSLKEIINAIVYINKTGCQWRMLSRISKMAISLLLFSEMETRRNF